jgi:hypothetical protein
VPEPAKRGRAVPLQHTLQAHHKTLKPFFCATRANELSLPGLTLEPLHLATQSPRAHAQVARGLLQVHVRVVVGLKLGVELGIALGVPHLSTQRHTVVR